MSNARAFLRLAPQLCLFTLVACAQGVPSPGIEDLSDGSGGTSGDLSSSGTSSISGSVGTFGGGGGTSTSQGGTFGVAGTVGTGVAGYSGSPAGGATGTAGSSAGGVGSGGASAGGAGGTGTAGASSVGGGTGTLGCTYLQPGDTGGLQVQYKPMDASASVSYIYFQVEIDNGYSNPVSLTDLHLRYYFNNDLTTPVTDFYTPLIKLSNGNTMNVDSGSLQATYTPKYVEVTTTAAGQINKGESFSFQVHMHSDPQPTMHTQAGDYSFNSSTTLAPDCKLVLYQQTALAWGILPPS